MASILTPRVAAASRSGYSAPPDRLDHMAYAIGHCLYSRRTPVGHRQEATKDDNRASFRRKRRAARYGPAAPRRMRVPARACAPAARTPLPGSGSDTATVKGPGRE
ncbi:hypothetical protein D9753_08810 [Streptomyces dangxiongensis]|uniref:Uncharacterized protein n=1 Tax=Streptomyces dangxiongensis TaxID=1442032 RepID=A0A3G2J9N8_9ACTN|nr:hypothetical protein D9753_08810 [Streptomyces dangxiongensis]